MFIDCEPKSGNLDPAKLEELITPRTRAISLVHFLGVPCAMDAIMAIARKHDLRVVEDCALAVGARYRDAHVGLIGDVGCFSFYPVTSIGSATLSPPQSERYFKNIALQGRGIALVGGAGFIGHHLALYLKAGADVHVVDGLSVNNLLHFNSEYVNVPNREL